MLRSLYWRGWGREEFNLQSTHFLTSFYLEPESGETMKAAGLKPIATLLDTSAVLIKSKHPSHPELIDRICSRIHGVIG